MRPGYTGPLPSKSLNRPTARRTRARYHPETQHGTVQSHAGDQGRGTAVPSARGRDDTIDQRRLQQQPRPRRSASGPPRTTRATSASRNAVPACAAMPSTATKRSQVAFSQDAQKRRSSTFPYEAINRLHRTYRQDSDYFCGSNWTLACLRVR